jgi:hypothetical protein
VIGGRVMLTATQDPRMDLRLLDCGSSQACHPGVSHSSLESFRGTFFGSGLLHTV